MNNVPGVEVELTYFLLLFSKKKRKNYAYGLTVLSRSMGSKRLKFGFLIFYAKRDSITILRR